LRAPLSVQGFNQGQARADLVPVQAERVVEPCCETCIPAEALAFKNSLPTKRVRIQIAPKDETVPSQWVAYQTEKCGPLEYNIYNPNIFISFANDIGYELDPRSAIYADGLAHIVPPAAPFPHNLPCCLLEAKYSNPNPRQALYVDRLTFVNSAGDKRWLKWAHARQQTMETIGDLLLRRRRRKKPDNDADSLKEFAGEKWDRTRRLAVAQLTAYAIFCRSRSSPYTVFRVICGEKAFVYRYFSAIVMAPGQAVHAPFGGANWVT
jgi:hypothetical protein